MTVKCQICDGTIEMKADGTGAKCRECGVEYPIELVKKLNQEGKIEEAAKREKTERSEPAKSSEEILEKEEKIEEKKYHTDDNSAKEVTVKVKEDVAVNPKGSSVNSSNDSSKVNVLESVRPCNNNGNQSGNYKNPAESYKSDDSESGNILKKIIYWLPGAFILLIGIIISSAGRTIESPVMALLGALICLVGAVVGIIGIRLSNR